MGCSAYCLMGWLEIAFSAPGPASFSADPTAQARVHVELSIIRRASLGGYRAQLMPAALNRG